MKQQLYTTINEFKKSLNENIEPKDYTFTDSIFRSEIKVFNIEAPHEKMWIGIAGHEEGMFKGYYVFLHQAGNPNAYDETLPYNYKRTSGQSTLEEAKMEHKKLMELAKQYPELSPHKILQKLK